MKKRIMALLLVLMIFGTGATVHAEEKHEPMKCVDINELAGLPYEETYSYQEVLRDMQLNNISKDQINEFVANNSKMSALQTEEIRYSTFYMDTYSFRSDFSYVLQPRIYVGLLYRNGSYSPSKIVSLDSPFMFTGAGNDCDFVGTIFYRLEAGNRFFMGINGDVYKTANVTTSGGVQIKIGGAATISFAATSSNNYLRNIAYNTSYYSAGLEP